MNFNEELHRQIQDVGTILETYLPKEEGFQRTLLGAMDYSILAGGKRLRPILMKCAYELYGGTGQEIRPMMAALEMVHTYSLVHDDLPALDNDEYRRGKKTTHAVYGEAMAILAGDGLLNYAFETAAQAFDMECDIRNAARALQILARKSGINGMLGGQSLDVELDGQTLTDGQLDFIHRLKTGALIECALMMGAALAGAGEDEISRMEKIGGWIGFAFQVQDDILDVVGDEKKLGKPIGSDEKNNKTTYVTLYGMEKAEETVKTLTDRAVALLDELPQKDSFLRELLLSLVGRDY